MGTIPQETIQKIKDYTPRDKYMKSPTADHIKSLLRDVERYSRDLANWYIQLEQEKQNRM